MSVAFRCLNELQTQNIFSLWSEPYCGETMQFNSSRHSFNNDINTFAFSPDKHRRHLCAYLLKHTNLPISSLLNMPFILPRFGHLQLPKVLLEKVLHLYMLHVWMCSCCFAIMWSQFNYVYCIQRFRLSKSVLRLMSSVLCTEPMGSQADYSIS